MLPDFFSYFLVTLGIGMETVIVECGFFYYSLEGDEGEVFLFAEGLKLLVVALDLLVVEE